MLSAAELISHLHLQPHPEGGHYRETYRAAELVQTPRGTRSASTAILYLLEAGERSSWHRIASDEAWHHHGGCGLVIHELGPDGQTRRTQLGLDLEGGEQPQHVVPAGSWFAAEPAGVGGWSLMSCTVAPGFEFADFELAQAHQLEAHAVALSTTCGDWRSLLTQAR